MFVIYETITNCSIKIKFIKRNTQNKLENENKQTINALKYVSNTHNGKTCQKVANINKYMQID